MGYWALMPGPEQQPHPLKERVLRRLRPEIGRELLPLAHKLTGKPLRNQRVDQLDHDVKGVPFMWSNRWSATCRQEKVGALLGFRDLVLEGGTGASGGTRTHGRRFTKPLLCR